MARPRKNDPTVIPSNSLVASGMMYPGKIDTIYRQKNTWQTESIRLFDITPELRFAAGWIANALSRVTLFPATVDEKGNKVPTTDPKIVGLFNSLFNGQNGQASMLAAFGLHLTVVGEAFLVGRVMGSQTVWEVIGISEIRVTGSQWAIDYGDGKPAVVLGAQDIVLRVWRPHPMKRIDADSPVRALIPVLREIEKITRHIDAQTTSRLIGNGILPLPQSIVFPGTPTADGKGNAADAFMAMLGDVMVAAMQDPGSAAAMAPIVLLVPDDAIDKIKEPIHFWSPLDEHAPQIRSSAIGRFAVGMDLPPEVILGMSGGSGTETGSVNHWTSWQIEESAIKLHIEPLVELIVNAIAVTWLRVASGNPLAAIGYDTTALKLQPDRSKEALELWDRGELKAEVMRRETGFDETGAPDDSERKDWLLRKVAGGSATPEQVGAALQKLGVDLPIPPPSAVPNEARPAPSLLDRPAPHTEPDDSAALIAAAEACVFRALERAGNRLRNQTPKPPPVPAPETYLYLRANGSTPKLLEDAWTYVPQIMSGMGDVAAIQEALDSYTSTIISEQAPHDRERMKKFLSLACKVTP